MFLLFLYHLQVRPRNLERCFVSLHTAQAQEEQAAIAAAKGVVSSLETLLQAATTAQDCMARLKHQLSLQNTNEEFERQAAVLQQITESRAQKLSEIVTSEIENVQEHCLKQLYADKVSNQVPKLRLQSASSR